MSEGFLSLAMFSLILSEFIFLYVLPLMVSTSFLSSVARSLNAYKGVGRRMCKKGVSWFFFGWEIAEVIVIDEAGDTPSAYRQRPYRADQSTFCAAHRNNLYQWPSGMR